MSLLACLVLAQSVFTFTDPKNDVSIRARDGMGTMSPKGWEFDLKGNVELRSKTDRIQLNASHVKAFILAGSGGKAANQLQSATATGGVTVIQSGPAQVAQLSGSTAVYKAKGANGEVDVQGSVRIITTDSRKRQTLVATGSRGHANLNRSRPRGLESATLNGPVRVELIQASDQGGKVVFTGNRLTLANNQITLSGNVKATGSGASRFGNLGNVDSIVANLNDKGEMTSFRFRSGGNP